GGPQSSCDFDPEAGYQKQTAQCDSECRPKAQDGELSRSRGARCSLRSEDVGVHGLCSFLIVSFDTMHRSGRGLFQAGLTTPYHFLDFWPASRTMARGTS